MRSTNIVHTAPFRRAKSIAIFAQLPHAIADRPSALTPPVDPRPGEIEVSYDQVSCPILSLSILIARLAACNVDTPYTYTSSP